jgi:flagellar basal body-associated protein FliL
VIDRYLYPHVDDGNKVTHINIVVIIVIVLLIFVCVIVGIIVFVMIWKYQKKRKEKKRKSSIVTQDVELSKLEKIRLSLLKKPGSGGMCVFLDWIFVL